MMAAHQEATRQWWQEQRQYFELFVSEAVIQEAFAGDSEAAKRRLEAIQGVPELKITNEVRELAKAILEAGGLPAKAAVDALHIAIATHNGIDYLLTWNCRHIANATLRKSISQVCEDAGLLLPILCTPLELTWIEE